jgi:hypothetical protein
LQDLRLFNLSAWVKPQHGLPERIYAHRIARSRFCDYRSPEPGF